MKNMFLIFIALGFAANVCAKTLKIAFLAPEGSSWTNVVKEMVVEIAKKTDGRVKVKPYFGGVAGDEPDVLRKIRIGQFHGGIFSGKTLGDIYSNVRIMEVPFTFYHDRDLAMDALNSLYGFLNDGFEKAGMKNLGFFEIGKVYVVSQKKAENIEELRGIKIWAWEGDKVVKALLNALNLVSVPLALPDVLSSLSTGIIDAAYASPLAIIALQWHTKVKYLIDYPVAFAISAFLVDLKNWKKIKVSDQKEILAIAKKFTQKANKQTHKENTEALNTLKKMGVEFVQFPKSDLETSRSIRDKVVKQLQSKTISKKAFKKLEEFLKDKDPKAKIETVAKNKEGKNN